jgi:hypothetical protein
MEAEAGLGDLLSVLQTGWLASAGNSMGVCRVRSIWPHLVQGVPRGMGVISLLTERHPVG